MYAAATELSATAALPFLYYGKPLDIGPIPIQVFGVIVAAGVLIGAAILRRYAEWHGVADEHIRGLTGWITVTGFIGAHIFDVLMYQWPKLESDPLLIFKIWDGISSYGGFVGGAAGFAIYVWWKRLPALLYADIAIIGLLPAFSIGRIGCTVVSDHIGAVVDKAQWYAALAMEYPRDPKVANFEVVQEALRARDPATGKLLHPDTGDGMITMWNLGLIEFLYLVPVNALLLWLAFRPSKRLNAGLIAVLAGLFYAPIRFFLEYLRPETSDPRHLGFTFAQWCSIVAFGVAIYVARRVMSHGKPVEPVTRTSAEMQARLKVILKSDDDDKADAKRAKGEAKDDKKSSDKKKPEVPPVPATEPSVQALPKDMGKDQDKAKTDAKGKAQADAAKADDKNPALIDDKGPAANRTTPQDEGAEVSAEEVKKGADNPGDAKKK